MPEPLPIRLCHPIWRLSRGGLENQLLRLLRRLPESSFAHIIVTRESPDPGVAEEVAELPNVEIVPLPGAAREAAWSRRLAVVLREEGVELLHVRGLGMLPDAVMAAESCGGVATAFSFHGFEQDRVDWSLARRAVYRAAIGRCDARWAVSRRAADALAEELGIAGSDFDVLHNGVDVNAWRPSESRDAVRASLGVPRDDLLILSVGNLKPIKGHDTLLESFERLVEDGGRAVLVLAGEDFSGGALEKWARRNLPAARVRFLGSCPDVLPWYQAADVFVLPSRFEGHSNALLEAMACCLPALVTDAGGNGEVVSPDRTGLLVPVGDSCAMAEALGRLLADANLRRQLGAAGRAAVCRRFNLTLTAARYESRYMSLAGRVATEQLCPT